MLQFRRVLAFSSRVHTYLLMLYVFFAVVFMFTFFVDADPGLVELLRLCMGVISWTMVFGGVWIVLASVYQLFYSKVFAFSPVALTAARLALMLVLSTLADALDTLATTGVSL